MNQFTKKANPKVVEKTIQALKQNGIEAIVVTSKEEAKAKVLEIIPKGVEVMDMTSVTLTEMGLVDILHNSGDYQSTKVKLSKMNRETDQREMQRLGSAPEWAIGSVHAVTENGQVIVASNSGSQIPAYVYGADHVIWVVGTQKIVKDLDEGLERIQKHSLELESKRVQSAYGMDHSNVAKLLIVNKETKQNRITLIFIDEEVGY